MPERQTISRAKRDLEKGRAPTTAAGEFVREEIHHIREGKHGARSTKQAIAIALSKARRAGVPLAPQKNGRNRRAEERDLAAGRSHKKPSRKRSRAVEGALRQEGHGAGSHRSLVRQAKRTSARRGHAARAASARKGARTKGSAVRHAAARKAARTRKAHR
jgi:hypothetical protein